MKTLQTKKEPNEVLLRERKEGLMLVSSLRPLVNNLTVTTPEDYQTADELLAKVRSGRAVWKAKMAKILDPLNEALKMAKKSRDAATGLYDEVDGPMQYIELEIKESMRVFKVEELRQIQAADDERRREYAKIEDELRKKDEAEAKAKSPKMVATIIDAKARLQQALADKKAESVAAPVKADASVARVTKRCRVTDIYALIGHIVLGYDLIGLVQIDMAQLNAYFKLRECPMGEFIPGVVGEEIVSIAGKR